MISEITEDKNLPLMAAVFSKQDFFLHGLSVFYLFTSMGFLLVFRAPDSTVTSSTFNHSHKTCAGPK